MKEGWVLDAAWGDEGWDGRLGCRAGMNEDWDVGLGCEGLGCKGLGCRAAT